LRVYFSSLVEIDLYTREDIVFLNDGTMNGKKILKISINDKKCTTKVKAEFNFNEHHIKTFDVEIWDIECKVKVFIDTKKKIMKLSKFDSIVDKKVPRFTLSFSLFTKRYLDTYYIEIFEGMWLDYINQLYSAYEDSKLPTKASTKDSIIIKKMLNDLIQSIGTIGLAINYKEYIEWMQRELRDTEKAKADVYIHRKIYN